MNERTYHATLEYLFSATDYEKMRRVRYNADTFNLDRVSRLLGALGSPHSGLRVVHLAGTKGKGSTAAMVHRIGVECGRKVGLYTSPHLQDLRERICVGDHPIAPEELAVRIRDARPHVERLRAEDDAPTFFEIFTALALAHFARVGVDLAVLETGLGGRLDATNVVSPDVSVITAISLDHTRQLGGTLSAIAREKAGIIKPGVPVVSQPQPADAERVIEAVCREAASPLIRVGKDVTYAWSPAEVGGRPGVRLSVRTPAASYEGLFLPLMGEHQVVNAASALAAAEQTPVLAEGLTPGIARKALAGIQWPGRMEYVPGTPPVVLDGAHNRASMESLMAALGCHFPGHRPAVIFGAAADKDVDGMLAVLAECLPAAPVFFTRTDNPRAADPTGLVDCYGRLANVETAAIGEPAEAVRRACAAAGAEGLVVVCGSLYLVGEVRTALRGAGGVSPEERA